MPMAPSSIGQARTAGASHFNPDTLFDAWGSKQQTPPKDNDLAASIKETFNLPHNDQYVYHAIASVTLSQVQVAINHGNAQGLHAWYFDEEGNPLPSPPSADIQAYTSIFASTTSTIKALNAFTSNAKKDSHRMRIASHLQNHRLIPSVYTIPKLKKPHINPYYDFWAWSCQNLEWAGPDEGTVKVHKSHHILPVFMHHFGCVVPSYEALSIIAQTAVTRSVVEIGSGDGYWTYMLRRLSVKVTAVDNIQSEYRTLWISDTTPMDGEKYLNEVNGARDAVLLLVYPIVGQEFTSKILNAYEGNTICIAGTQNRNGYTAFRDRTIEEYMAAEKPEYRKDVQVALPSFAGKDEALFVFERRREGGNDETENPEPAT